MNNEELISRNTIYASGFFYYITKSHDSYLYSYMKEYGLKGNEYPFLLYLFDYNGTTQIEIAESFKIPKSQVSRSFKKLEEKGLVKREKNKDNRKYNKLFLTPKAYEIIEKLAEAEIKWSEMIYNSINADKEKSREILTKIATDALNFTDKEVK